MTDASFPCSEIAINFLKEFTFLSRLDQESNYDPTSPYYDTDDWNLLSAYRRKDGKCVFVWRVTNHSRVINGITSQYSRELGIIDADVREIVTMYGERTDEGLAIDWYFLSEEQVSEIRRLYIEYLQQWRMAGATIDMKRLTILEDDRYDGGEELEIPPSITEQIASFIPGTVSKKDIISRRRNTANAIEQKIVGKFRLPKDSIRGWVKQKRRTSHNKSR